MDFFIFVYLQCSIKIFIRIYTFLNIVILILIILNIGNLIPFIKIFYFIWIYIYHFFKFFNFQSLKNLILRFVITKAFILSRILSFLPVPYLFQDILTIPNNIIFLLLLLLYFSLSLSLNKIHNIIFLH